MPREAEQVIIENVIVLPIPFRNFEGREGMYNRKGDRNFSILLTPEIAADLLDMGYNVKLLKAREEEEEEKPYLTVAVNFANRPPRIVMITSRAKTPLDENTVEVLDWADIKFADLIINPYNWGDETKGGVKAYLKSLFVTIEEDALERKYAINEVEG